LHARKPREQGRCEDEHHTAAPQDSYEIERRCLPGLVNILREEGLEAVRYLLWDVTGWHHDPCLWRNRASGEHKRVGWETWAS
jgi:hypothetical protein